MNYIRNHETPTELLGLLTKLMEAALRLNRNDFSVFVWFSGHVGRLEVSASPGGWREDENNKVYWNFRLTEVTPEDIERITQTIEDLSTEQAEARAA
jgi:hypothetical protein